MLFTSNCAASDLGCAWVRPPIHLLVLATKQSDVKKLLHDANLLRSARPDTNLGHPALESRLLFLAHQHKTFR